MYREFPNFHGLGSDRFGDRVRWSKIKARRDTQQLLEVYGGRRFCWPVKRCRAAWVSYEPALDILELSAVYVGLGEEEHVARVAGVVYGCPTCGRI